MRRYALDGAHHRSAALQRALPQGLQGVGLLTRRIGAQMLRRAAERAGATPELPDAARGALVDGNNALADAIAPTPAPLD